MYYDVLEVAALDGRRFSLAFEDGSRGVFDMAGYLGLPLFAPLRSAALFSRAFVDEGTVAWPGDIDIAPERLRSDCVPHGGERA
jgi:hypothetical protein